MNWRRGFLRLWVVLAVVWAFLVYVNLDPGHDLFQEAVVSLSDIEIRVPLTATEEGARKVLIEYGAKNDRVVPDTRIAQEVDQIMTEVRDLRQRNAAERRFQWEMFAIYIAGVPVAVLLLGFTAGWVVAGFKRRRV